MSCDTSEYVTLLYSLETETKLALYDYFLASHLPINRALSIAKFLKQEKWQWFDKLAVFLENGDSVAWSGSLLHSCHTLKKEGFALYFVLRIHEPLPEAEEVFEDEEEDEDDDAKMDMEELLHTTRLREQLGDYPDINFPHYREGFDWKFNPTDMLDWITKNQRRTISDIHANIQIKELLQFKCDE